MPRKSVGFLVLLLIGTAIVGCSTEKAGLRVGMVTDTGTIYSEAFSQGIWEGIILASDDFGIETNYLTTADTAEADHVIEEISDLYDAGFKFIVCPPGFAFETAIFKAQDMYPDAKFVIIDGTPHAGDFVPIVKENTVAVSFAEHEAGFLAGVAAAVELKVGQLGFIGGMEIPGVKRFNWGFQQGLRYANESFGTNMTIKAENVVYQGSFDNVEAGRQIAAQMFDKGVDAIFTAAGMVGVGAIEQAQSVALTGKDAWIIGADVDQYAAGVFEGDKSVILTSAMKCAGQAAYNMIKAELEGKFPGGQTLIYDVKNNGVGIPDYNPNLSREALDMVADTYAKLQSGEIVVSDTQGDLIK